MIYKRLTKLKRRKVSEFSDETLHQVTLSYGVYTQGVSGSHRALRAISCIRAISTYCLQQVNRTTTPIPSTAIPPRLIDVIVIAVTQTHIHTCINTHAIIHSLSKSPSEFCNRDSSQNASMVGLSVKKNEITLTIRNYV